MKLGVSTYCFAQNMQTGAMSILDVIDCIADIDGEHAEIVSGSGLKLAKTPELVAAIRKKASDRGIQLSNYAIGAQFAGLDEEAFEREIARVKREVDVAAELGVKRMRHDVASSADISDRQFAADLPRLVLACREIADYAAPLGITTSVENHGYYVQASARVRELVQEVGRDNFRTTVDIGNFVCVDEEPVEGVRNNIALASMVHVKDFYRRPADLDPGESWFRSANGTYLRGAIVGHGDLDIRAALAIVKHSGYDGDLSIEFEGLEPCVQATKIALDNTRRFWAEA